MKLPLRFIANKLAFSYDIEVLNENPNQKYGTVRLFDSALSVSTRFDPLVVVSAQFENHEIPYEFEGIIWLGSRVPRTEQPTIWVKGGVNELLILDRVQNIFDMHDAWCDSVREALLRQEAFADVVPLLSHVTVNPFYYADASFRTLAIKDDDTLYASSSSWRMQSEIGRHPVEILSRFIASGELAAINGRHDAWLFDSSTFHTPFVSRTIFCQGDVFGHLFIVEAYPDQEVFDVEVLEELGSLLEKHLNLSSMPYFSTGRPFEPMLKNQLAGTAQSDSETNYLLKLLSWRRDDRFRVVVFSSFEAAELSSQSDTVASAEVQAVEDNLSSGKAFLFEDRLVCVINESRPEAVSNEDLVLHLCERFNWKAAVSNLGFSFDAVRALYKRAMATMEAGVQDNPDGMMFRFEDYRLAIVFAGLERSADEDFLMHDDLRALIDYDARNDSELVDTLKTYLDNERNVSRTAEAMFLHRNSIAYRLDKIRSLVASDLDDPENRLFLALSIYLWYGKKGMAPEPRTL